MALITSYCGKMHSPSIKWPESPRILRPSDKSKRNLSGKLEAKKKKKAAVQAHHRVCAVLLSWIV